MRSAPPIALVAWLLIAAAPPDAKDPQARVEPRSGPGLGQEFLARFAGDWEVVKVFHPRSGDPVRVEGTCRQAMTHGGRFLQSDFVFGRGDARTTGTGIIGFEPAPGRFTSVWTDSRATGMSLRQSRDPFDGRQIVLYSRSLEPDGLEARSSRTVTLLEDEGRRIVHRQHAFGPEGEGRLVMELIMTRKVPRGE